MKTIKATVLKHTDNHVLISYHLNDFCTEGVLGMIKTNEQRKTLSKGDTIDIPSNPIRYNKHNIETGELLTTKANIPLSFLRWE
tara:strand:- start:151 stop:402 length:252 start_codon:yes stop_codon:yes gene_type:complete